MKSEILIQKYESFQPEIQKEIVDFIEYLEIKYKTTLKIKDKKKPSLEKESFVGMWSSRPEMKDSDKYIKELRKKHWKKS
ncbi:MAG TPA: hypothetical protein PLX69_09735 [Leptospiraceae bacterium]|jgi:hypothetical protein|nr:hypothetical protein [Leptospiraceae bacterium]MBP9886144.1 hypothetical protein [Leptospiraceae bacterium]HRG47821.1 hypothetical protein [Leptospiraceae bacterium]HRG74828.1 hypothetical protein [Leptospiraceae bacterium]